MSTSTCRTRTVALHPEADPTLDVKMRIEAAQDLLVPTIHLSREYSQSPLQGHPPHKRDILLFLRGDVGQHRRAFRSLARQISAAVLTC